MARGMGGGLARMRGGLGRLASGGGGGGAAPFYPSDIAGGQWLYDAARGITLSGADVDAWADQSGRGNDLSAASAGVRPLLNVSDAQMNGQPSVEGDGASEWLRRAVMSLSGTLSNLTVFVVMKLVTNVNGRAAWTMNNTTLSFGEITVGRISSRVVTNTVISSTNLGTATVIAEMHYNGTTHSLLINGVSEGTPAAQTGTIASGLRLSLFANMTGGTPSASKFGFHGAWTGLTTGQRDTIRDYLSERFL